MTLDFLMISLTNPLPNLAEDLIEPMGLFFHCWSLQKHPFLLFLRQEDFFDFRVSNSKSTFGIGTDFIVLMSQVCICFKYSFPFVWINIWLGPLTPRSLRHSLYKSSGLCYSTTYISKPYPQVRNHFPRFALLLVLIKVCRLEFGHRSLQR